MDPRYGKCIAMNDYHSDIGTNTNLRRLNNPKWVMAELSLLRPAQWYLPRLAISHKWRLLCRDWFRLTRLYSYCEVEIVKSIQSMLNWNEFRSAQSKSTQLNWTCSASLIAWAKLWLVWAMLTVSEQTRVHPGAACWLVETDSMLRDRASHTELAQP